jgi:ribosomal protein L7/L12
MDDTLDQVRQLVASGCTIDAIKLYREATGLGLKEAKEAIDRYADGGSLELAADVAARNAVHAGGQIDGEIKKLLEAGRKLEAVKLLRAKSGLDLATAKDIIDSKEDDLRRARGAYPGSAGVVQRGSGAMRWVILALVTAAALAAYFLLRAGS